MDKKIKFIILLFNLIIIFLIGMISATTSIYDCGILNTTGTTYQLQNDISNTSSDATCIDIIANNIIFDLNGYTITGEDQQSSPTKGINVSNANNILIKNGNITNEQYGIIIDSASNNITIDDIYFKDIDGYDQPGAGSSPGGDAYGIYIEANNSLIKNIDFYDCKGGDGEEDKDVAKARLGSGGTIYIIYSKGKNIDYRNISIEKIRGGDGGDAGYDQGTGGHAGYIYLFYVDKDGNNFDNITLNGIKSGEGGGSSTSDDGTGDDGNIYGFYIRGDNNVFNNIKIIETDYGYGMDGYHYPKDAYDYFAGHGGNTYVFDIIGNNNSITNSILKNITGGHGDEMDGEDDRYYDGGHGGDAYVFKIMGNDNLIQNTTIENVVGGAGGDCKSEGCDSDYGGVGYAIYVEGHNLTISKNNITNIMGGKGGLGDDGNGGDGGTTAGIYNIGYNLISVSNIIYTITGGHGGDDGGSPGHSGDGGYAYGIYTNGNNANVTNNIVKYILGGDIYPAGEGDTGDGSKAYGLYLSGDNSEIHSNLIYNIMAQADDEDGTSSYAYGFYFNDVDNSVFTNNKISYLHYNDGYAYTGYFYNSVDNIIKNNIFNETSLSYSYGLTSNNNGINVWNQTKTLGTNIVGGSYLGGNLIIESDGTGHSQTCNDVDDDTICDSSYTFFDNNIDYLPLLYLSAPEITIVSPGGGSYYSNTVNFNITTDKNTSWCGYSLDHASNVNMNKNSDTAFGYIKTELSSGTHNISFVCNSSYSIMSNPTSLRTFYVDINPPITTATATSPPGGPSYTFGSTTNDTVQITLNCNDTKSGCKTGYPKYCTDSNNTCSPTTTYSSMINISNEGTNYIRYYSKDNVENNETIKSSTIIIEINYTKNPSMYVNGIQVWNYTDYFETTETTNDFAQQLNDVLDACEADAEGYCNIPITLHSDSAGKINISDINIYFNITEYIWNISNLAELSTYKVRIRALDDLLESDWNESDEDFTIGAIVDNPPIITLISPSNNSIDEDGIIIFNCSATDDNGLVNITLYGNWGNGWHANETKSLSGSSNSTTFTKTLSQGVYIWNCLAYDNASQNDFANTNWTINSSVSNTAPIITSTFPTNSTHIIIEPNGQQFNISYTDNENDSAISWYLNGENVENLYTGDYFKTKDTNDDPIGIDKDDVNIWVLDFIDRKIYKYNLNGVFNESFNTTTNNRDPFGIIQNGTYIWITDRNDSIVYKYYINGTYTGDTFSLTSSNNDSFGITKDDNYFWVVDNSGAEIYKYYINGTYVGDSFDTSVSGNNNPIGISTDGNHLWVTDENNTQFYQYYNNGTFINSFNTLIENNEPAGIVKEGDYFWISDIGTNKIYKYHINGNIHYFFEGNYTSAGNYNVTVIIADAEYADSYEWNLTVNNANNHPSIETVSISPFTPLLTDILDCGFIVTDEDNDSLIVNVTWFKNDQFWTDDDENNISVVSEQIANTSSIGDIESNDTIKNDGWICSINAYDGIDWSGWVNSTEIFIDTYKFYIKNDFSENVAFLDNIGNIFLKGICTNQTNCTAPEDSFIIANYTDDTTAYIDNNGNMCVEKGDCLDQSASCNPLRDAFIIRNASNYNMSYIDFDGDLCLTGRLYENANL